MMKSNKKSKDISFLRVISNILYVLKLIWHAAPGRIGYESIISLLSAAVGVGQLYILRYVLNGIQTGMSFQAISSSLIGFILIVIIYYGGLHLIDIRLGPYFDYKLKYYLKSITFKKSKSCELACYENPEFYNQYTKAMAECEDRAEEVMDHTSGLVYYIFYLLSTGTLLIMIDPIMLIFIAAPPIIGLVVKKAHFKKFQLDQTLIPLNRVKTYTTRTFFWKDYAAEMKLTNIHHVIGERFIQATKDTISVYKAQGFQVALLQFLASVLSELFSQYLILLYAAWQTLGTGKMKYGDCLVLVTVVNNIYLNIRGFINRLTDVYSDALYIDNLRYFMDYEPKIGMNQDNQDVKYGDIKFENVSFTYEGNEEEAIKNLSLEIKQGEKIAIVGHNGAGKTTFVKLLLRLYDPTAGYITMNGQDIKILNLEQYRDIFAPVLQDYKQLSMTVSENVLLRPAKEGDDEVVKRALENSGIYNRICNLPNGIHSVLGREFDDEGVILSGGESQKIALAHVYAADCPVIILDEPSSALDPIAEHQMYENMMRACENKTVIIISHRLSSAVSADRIYLMDHGRVIETGSHDSLIQKQGLYFDMFNRQAENYRGGEDNEKRKA